MSWYLAEDQFWERIQQYGCLRIYVAILHHAPLVLLLAPLFLMDRGGDFGDRV
jgi:hypothetical protein